MAPGALTCYTGVQCASLPGTLNFQLDFLEVFHHLLLTLQINHGKVYLGSLIPGGLTPGGQNVGKAKETRCKHLWLRWGSAEWSAVP